jgi:hypothetical protein
MFRQRSDLSVNGEFALRIPSASKFRLLPRLNSPAAGLTGGRVPTYREIAGILLDGTLDKLNTPSFTIVGTQPGVFFCSQNSAEFWNTEALRNQFSAALLIES